MSDWILTDDESYQHIKRNPDGTFSCLELLLTDVDPSDESKDVYSVGKDLICLDEYKEELEEIVKTFDYSGVQEVKDEYGDSSDQIIAECIFEYYDGYGEETLFEGTRKECEAKIDELIREN